MAMMIMMMVVMMMMMMIHYFVSFFCVCFFLYFAARVRARLANFLRWRPPRYEFCTYVNDNK